MSFEDPFKAGDVVPIQDNAVDRSVAFRINRTYETTENNLNDNMIVLFIPGLRFIGAIGKVTGNASVVVNNIYHNDVFGQMTVTKKVNPPLYMLKHREISYRVISGGLKIYNVSAESQLSGSYEVCDFLLDMNYVNFQIESLFENPTNDMPVKMSYRDSYLLDLYKNDISDQLNYTVGSFNELNGVPLKLRSLVNSHSFKHINSTYLAAGSANENFVNLDLSYVSENRVFIHDHIDNQFFAKLIKLHVSSGNQLRFHFCVNYEIISNVPELIRFQYPTILAAPRAIPPAGGGGRDKVPGEITDDEQTMDKSNSLELSSMERSEDRDKTMQQELLSAQQTYKPNEAAVSAADESFMSTRTAGDQPFSLNVSNILNDSVDSEADDFDPASIVLGGGQAKLKDDDDSRFEDAPDLAVLGSAALKNDALVLAKELEDDTHILSSYGGSGFNHFMGILQNFFSALADDSVGAVTDPVDIKNLLKDPDGQQYYERAKQFREAKGNKTDFPSYQELKDFVEKGQADVSAAGTKALLKLGWYPNSELAGVSDKVFNEYAPTGDKEASGNELGMSAYLTDQQKDDQDLAILQQNIIANNNNVDLLGVGDVDGPVVDVLPDGNILVIADAAVESEEDYQEMESKMKRKRKPKNDLRTQDDRDEIERINKRVRFVNRMIGEYKTRRMIRSDDRRMLRSGRTDRTTERTLANRRLEKERLKALGLKNVYNMRQYHPEYYESVYGKQKKQIQPTIDSMIKRRSVIEESTSNNPYNQITYIRRLIKDGQLDPDWQTSMKPLPEEFDFDRIFKDE